MNSIKKDIKKVLLTGATGCIGSRLKYKLLEKKGIELRLFVRDRKKLPADIGDSIEVVEGDTFNNKALSSALENIDIAYYLIHSWNEGVNLEKFDKISATNFRDACIIAGVKKIIFLGGLGVRKTAGKELLSRIETGKILNSAKNIKMIWFRSSIVIGAGSSYKILIHLTKKIPIFFLPDWFDTKTEPIWIEDALRYLTEAIDLEPKNNLMVDIGTTKMSYKEMIKNTMKVMDLNKYIIPFPFMSKKLLAFICSLLTPVPYKKSLAMVNCIKSETVVTNNNAHKYFPNINPVPFEEALGNILGKRARAAG